MKVLWFSDTPSLANKRVLGTFGASMGWVEGLEHEFSKRGDIELAIAFPFRRADVDKFTVEKTVYYASPRYPLGKAARFAQRISCSLEPETSLKHFHEIIEDFKPDLIHIFGTENLYGLIIPQTNVPVVIWIQGIMTQIVDNWYNGISKGEVLRYSKLKSLINAESIYHFHIRSSKAGVREQRIFKHGQHFIGRTAWDRRVTSIMAPQANYYHCDEIMRPEFYERSWNKLDNTGKMILFTVIRGRIYKGLETVLDAAVHLKKIIGDNFEWRLAGIGDDDELLKMIQKMRKTKFRENNVIPLGRKDATGLVDQLVEADIYVHPSHIDNSPNTVCEAMVVGVPVIASNVGGVSTIVEDNKEGMLFQAGDSRGLAGSILELFRDKEMARTFSENGKHKSLIRNDRDKIVSDLYNIYEKVANKRIITASTAQV